MPYLSASAVVIHYEEALSVCTFTFTFIWPESRTERPRKTKIGTDSPRHIDSDTTFKVKRSTCRGPGLIVADSCTACLFKVPIDSTIVMTQLYSGYEYH